MASSEERVLYFADGCRAVLAYRSDGSIHHLRIELEGGRQLDISSTSMPDAPEKIYELLRECEVLTERVEYS